jgi:hypothetical protein
MYVGVICSRPTAYGKVAIKKYKRKNNIKLINLTFIHCTCKFEKHKQCFLSGNYEQTFPNKTHKQSNAHGNINSLSLPKTNRTRHARAFATSADSIPPRSLQHLYSL